MRRRRRLCPWSSWKPPKLLGDSAFIAVYSTVACDARHRFGEYVVEHAEHVSIVIAKNYSRRASLARLVPWDSLGTPRRLDVPQSAPKAPARPGLSFCIARQSGRFFEPDIDHFVMVITAAEAEIWHTSKPCRRNSRQCSAPYPPLSQKEREKGPCLRRS